MNKIKRSVNKKLISALMAYAGLNGSDVGLRCDPPVTRSAIHRVITGDLSSNRILSQITEILGPAALDLYNEFMSLNNPQNDSLIDDLFPCTQDYQVNTGEYQGNVPDIGGNDGQVCTPEMR
jgi:hypothetical protein